MSKNKPDQEYLFKTPSPMAKAGAPTPEQIARKKALEEEIKNLTNQVELPHLYGWKWYPWARSFVETRNKIALLCAANQISKSSTQIRKCIMWATDTSLWPGLWIRSPVQFWYLYPSQKVVNAEFETKWKLFLPKGEMKKDEYYGWDVEIKGGNIIALHFKSGVHVYFKTYSQSVTDLQSGTCDAIFCDEELPLEYYSELMFRVTASNGYFNMVFTATLGQEEWRLAMEPDEDEKESGKEFLPQAFKQTISLYDSMVYEDGSPSQWTLERIKEIESACTTHDEVLKRVHGRFIVLDGKRFPTFDLKKHMKLEHPIPEGWLVYEGVDIGSGNKAHKPAIVFVAVNPTFTAGRVFLSWRGDQKSKYTAGDVYQKHREMKKERNLTPIQQNYDWANADFGTISSRAGEHFEKADKSHEKGEEILNTLFANDWLLLYDNVENAKLGAELATLKKAQNKRSAKDDLADALRYAVSRIPWNWEALMDGKQLDEKPEEVLSEWQIEVKARREAFDEDVQKEEDRIQDEIDEWNESYGY